MHFLCFFFQAEDGIRDGHVTGVQTCALPICLRVGAVLAKHWPEIDARRHAMLDEYEAHPEAGLRALAAALVRPLGSKLADPDGGPEYLQIYAELINLPRTGEPAEGEGDDKRDSVQRW